MFLRGTINGALKNHVLKILWGTFIGSLKNHLIKWFFKEPWFERFLVEPGMVLLCHHSEEPFSLPDGTLIVLRVAASFQTRCLRVKLWIDRWGAALWLFGIFGPRSDFHRLRQTDVWFTRSSCLSGGISVLPRMKVHSGSMPDVTYDNELYVHCSHASHTSLSFHDECRTSLSQIVFLIFFIFKWFLIAVNASCSAVALPEGTCPCRQLNRPEERNTASVRGALALSTDNAAGFIFNH